MQLQSRDQTQAIKPAGTVLFRLLATCRGRAELSSTLLLRSEVRHLRLGTSEGSSEESILRALNSNAKVQTLAVLGC